MIDMIALFSWCAVQNGTHHIPADGLGIKSIVMPDDNGAFSPQELEGGFRVLPYALIVVVAINKNHIEPAEIMTEIVGL